jgi:hypothetical protein
VSGRRAKELRDLVYTAVYLAETSADPEEWAAGFVRIDRADPVVLTPSLRRWWRRHLDRGMTSLRVQRSR